MLIVEISALENGAHRNQNISGILAEIPEGWVVVPPEMEDEALGYLPFIELTMEGGALKGVAQGEIPEAEPEADVQTYAAEPTELEQLRADVDYIALMTGVEL